jgi:hypothetical protein
MVVNLLSDSHGIYGIGFIDEQLAERYHADRYHKPLILRPDLLKEAPFPTEYRTAMLTTIWDRSFRVMMEGYEGQLLEHMHRAALERNLSYTAYWPSTISKEEKVRQLHIKFGQRKRQFINFNGMLKKLLAVADPDALRLARRFHPVVRENIYKAAAISVRAQQLIDAFPLLGTEIYCPGEKENNQQDVWENCRKAAAMVERGVRLNRIAGFMDVPAWSRKLKPAVAHWSASIPDGFACYLPAGTTWEQRLWIRPFQYRCMPTDDPDFAYWVARHVLEIGNCIGPVIAFLQDMSDWVRECRREEPRCITRPFHRDMSLRTVRRLSGEWHEAVALSDQRVSNYVIPPPWYPSGRVNGYEIVPLDSYEALWREGREMHNCVGTYDHRVSVGACYIYSVRQGDKRLATVELVKENGKVKPVQIKGPCNADVPQEIKTAVRQYLRSRV